MPPVSELIFRRTAINLADAARLGEGEDLNDALLDFFIKLGQSLIPKGGDDKAPVAYLGSLFFKQLTSAFSTSGEEGWKHVQNWAKRKAGGLFKSNYCAFSVPINEDLKDEKGNEAGNHWWLALLLNPPGGARGEPTAVMVLDSMQRREKIYSEPQVAKLKGSSGYTVQVTKMEQAGYLLILTFIAQGDGSAGPLQRPEQSKLYVEDIALLKPELGLKVNMGGDRGVPGCFEGTLTFALDGRVRSSSFRLDFGSGGYDILNLNFDPFVLTKCQKTVSRFLGGYCAKEWETNGPAKKMRFEKQSAKALVADVHQQENLNDCGVFVLENTLRSISMNGEFLRSMASASPTVLRSFPWPTQEDITKRKEKLKAITARLFSAAADAGTTDLDKILKENAALREEVLASLTDQQAREANLKDWAGNFQKELAARQQDKEEIEAEKKRKEEVIQNRKMEAQLKKEEEERQRQEDIKKGKIKALPKVGKRRHISTSESGSRSRSRGDRKKKAKEKAKEKEKEKEREKAPKRKPQRSEESGGDASPPRKAKNGKRKAERSDASGSASPPPRKATNGKRKAERSDASGSSRDDRRRPKEKQQKEKDRRPKEKAKKRARSESDSRSLSPSDRRGRRR